MQASNLTISRNSKTEFSSYDSTSGHSGILYAAGSAGIAGLAAYPRPGEERYFFQIGYDGKLGYHHLDNTGHMDIDRNLIDELDDLNSTSYVHEFSINDNSGSTGYVDTTINSSTFPPISGWIFNPDSTSYDGYYIIFISSVTRRIYVGACAFSGGGFVPNVAIKGKLRLTYKEIDRN